MVFCYCGLMRRYATLSNMSTQAAHEEMNIPQWTLGDRLRKIRTSAGMSQEEFAAQLQVTASAYSHWESDRTTPRNVVTIAQRLEMMTGVPAAWILGISDGVSSGPEGPGGSKKGSSVPGANLRNSDYKAAGSGSPDNVFSFRPLQRELHELADAA